MKTWRIPVVWQETAMIDIVANTLREAVELAKDKDGVIPIPEDGVVIPGTWKVWGLESYIRTYYNNSQPDDIPTPKFKPVIYAEWLPKQGDSGRLYCSNCKSEANDIMALYYDFCPKCGAEMRAKSEVAK